MKSRSLFILCTFIILFGINKFSLHKDIHRQNENLTVVNISGKQRMYSQRISKLVLTYNNVNETFFSENTIKLEEILSEFSKAHQLLKSNYFEKYDDFYLKEYFGEIDMFYSNIIKNSRLLIKNQNDKTEINKYINLTLFNTERFLPIMDKIVVRYEEIGRNRGQSILNRELTFNIILAILSIYAVFFVIFPLANTKRE
ncbi:type IV pili methyl-accepting chemotaxis transducer N-terminal domain-containing protein [Polaribacter vadi]|uniref:type IV pili methyl-accepting chemotaxis transducer N-terminal domain-containing protein n=1 Tax=Polaribacter TaxID=52959 RepID=UPI001C09100F|nr:MULTISPECIES: type IV pili methyl-accepting chemotaxis transducer N-terminal domain-containing protein [Polaribacter]MBU3010899.1 type IV pili methyl-accepting chemotaxis transducer N-terminal domain-containing protein [Polaribacter vadi]MDO6740711.1 type IV pili methyl-accepting chemotaxis transducer N-terminal domain-containing protein [Polaribacter sp. 1_MG-2023]